MKVQNFLRCVLCIGLVVITELGALAVVYEVVSAWYMKEHQLSNPTALSQDMGFALTGVFWAGFAIAAALPVAIVGSRRIVRKLIPIQRPL